MASAVPALRPTGRGELTMGRGWSRWRTRLGALALTWGSTAHEAWAEGEGGHGAANPLNPQFDLGIWTIVIFVVLLLVLRKIAWGPMLEGLQRREQNIRQELEDAGNNRKAEVASVRS